MNFGEALDLLKRGRRVARAGWNGKGMWLFLVFANDVCLQRLATDVHTPSTATLSFGEDGSTHLLELAPYIGMKTADDKFVPWLASQTDVLAEDWERVGG